MAVWASDVWASTVWADDVWAEVTGVGSQFTGSATHSASGSFAEESSADDVWAIGVWASNVWEIGVWREGATDVGGVGTHLNAAQIHLADAAYAVGGIVAHVNAAQIHNASGLFDDSGLPAGVVEQVTDLLLSLFRSPGGLDASQILLLPVILSAVQVGANPFVVDNIIALIRTHMLGAVPEFQFNSLGVIRVSDADAHQQNVLIRVVRLLKPFSSNP